MNLQENINRIQQVMGIINEDSSTKETIFDMINDAVEGADLYEHEGLIWLIFNDEHEWIIKLNKEGVLWYNYYFFNSIFKYLSLNVVENQHYITKWVEDTIKNGVRSTYRDFFRHGIHVEDTIKNGVRSTFVMAIPHVLFVEDTIKNGVRSTPINLTKSNLFVEDTIKNGVKHTEHTWEKGLEMVQDVIKNGVKHTDFAWGNVTIEVEDTIKNGENLGNIKNG
jgi:hypothetical protein